MHSTLAEFDAAPGQSETVVRRGKLFAAGSYPDKSFSLTPEEMQDACRQFQPVPLDLEHRDTILSGKLGSLREAWSEGGVLFGAVEIPRWLHETVGEAPLKVSCTWDRATKRLTKLALVTQPRISDAALFAAFADAQNGYDPDEPRDEEGKWTSGAPDPAGRALISDQQHADAGKASQLALYSLGTIGPRETHAAIEKRGGYQGYVTPAGDLTGSVNEHDPDAVHADFGRGILARLGHPAAKSESDDEVHQALAERGLARVHLRPGQMVVQHGTLTRKQYSAVKRLAREHDDKEFHAEVHGEGVKGLPAYRRKIEGAAFTAASGNTDEDEALFALLAAGFGDEGQGGLGFSAEFDGPGGIHWVTINGAHDPITDKDVGPEHVSQATSRLGIGHHGHTALHAALDAGKIETDAHLYGVIRAARAHEAKGASEADAYAAAITSHGQDGPSVRITGQGTIKARGMAPLSHQATADLVRMHDASKESREAFRAVRAEIGDDRAKEAANHARRLNEAGLLAKAVTAHKAWQDREERADQERVRRDVAREESKTGQGGRGLVQEAASQGYDVHLQDHSTGRVHTYRTLPPDLPAAKYEEIFQELNTSGRQNTKGGKEKLYPVPAGGKLQMFTLHDLVTGEKKLPPGAFRRSASFSEAEFGDYGCAMCHLDENAADLVRKWAERNIPEEDRAEGGLETEPHITVRHGLHTTDGDEVAKAARGFGPVKAKLGSISLFRTPEYDVVKLGVDSPDLHRLHERLGTLEHTDTHPVYQPHLTLGYVKPGLGDKHIGKGPELVGRTVSFDRMTYSDRNKNRTQIPLAAGQGEFSAAKSGLKGDRMGKIRDAITGLLAKAGITLDPVTSEAEFAALEKELTPPAVSATGATPEQLAALRAEFAADLAAERRKRLESEAAAFAKDVIGSQKKALPAEFAALQQQYLDAATDDAASPREVTFGQDQKGSRVDALRAAVALRPAHHLTEELAGQQLAALFSGSAEEKEKPPVFDRDEIHKRRGEALANGKGA